MRVTKHRKFTVNMGNYESVTFGAEVTATNNDLGVSDEELAHVTGDTRLVLNDQLHAMVEENLRYALDEDVKNVIAKAPKTSKTASLSA